MSTKYNSGFTLLEILIALAIIGLFGAIVIPNLRPQLPRYEREEFIARLNSAIRLAQQQAIITHTLHRVRFNMTKRFVVVETEQSLPFAAKKN